MQRSKAITSVVTNARQSAASVHLVSPLTEAQAAQAMWNYYKNHKAQLIAHIKEYRATILSQLMTGLSAEQVFAPFSRPAVTVRASKRAA